MKRRVRVIRGQIWAEHLSKRLATPPVDAAQWMEEHTQIKKRDPYTLSGLLRIEGEECFLKLYRPRTLLYKILFVLGYGRPLRNFKVARALAADGLAVPAPLACVRAPDGVFLLIEGLSGDGNLVELWRRQPDEDKARKVMRAAGETLATLHNSGYAHGDCKWENLFWSGQRVYLVDLDDASKAARAGTDQARDLARFTASAEELSIGSPMYEQFLETYLHGIGNSRREVIGRMLPYLYRIRSAHLSKYGQWGQRLV